MKNKGFKNSFIGLCNFLKKSFDGGTDITNALEHALFLFQDKKWRNADALVISDFCMQSISKRLKLKIENAKKMKNKFYSLEIGNIANAKCFDAFSECYKYDIQNKNNNHIIRQF